MNMNNILTLFKKQLKNILHNSFVISSLVMMPVIAWLMGSGSGLEVGSFEHQNFFLFIIVVNTVINGINMIACLIAEEKEKNTLSVLMTSTISGLDFLISNVLVTFLAVIISNIGLYFLLSGHYLHNLLNFILISSIGIIASVIIGAIIGIFFKSQMIASSVAAGIGFLTIFSSDILYALNLPNFVNEIAYNIFPLPFIRLLMTPDFTYYEEAMATALSDPILILINVLITSALFVLVYKKRGLVI